MTESIEKKQLKNIATWMIPVQATQLPALLKGVFFMDGNPLPDTCITLQNLNWDKENLALLLPVAAPLQWTFHSSILGLLLLHSAQLSSFTYRIQFEDETLQNGQITPFIFGLPIPKWIVNATMCQDDTSGNGDIWKRKNLWFGGYLRVGEYILRKVVNEEGQYTSAFGEMLAKVQNECLVVARTA